MAYELTDFRTDVLEASMNVPVLVDFWADWCGPCRTLGPLLEKLAAEANGAWKLVKVDVDKNQELAAQFQVRGIPMCVLVHFGQIVDGFQGALPEAELRQWLAPHIQGGLAEQDEQVEELEPATPAEVSVAALLAAGKTAEAAALAERQLEAEATHENRLQVALAQMFVKPQRSAQILAKIPEDADSYDQAQHLAGLAKVLSHDLQALPAHANPKVPEYYKAAIEALQRCAFEEALDHFLEVLYRDKHYDEDGARLAFLGVFAWLGKDDPLPKAFQRRFEMAVFG